MATPIGCTIYSSITKRFYDTWDAYILDHADPLLYTMVALATAREPDRAAVEDTYKRHGGNLVWNPSTEESNQ